MFTRKIIQIPLRKRRKKLDRVRHAIAGVHGMAHIEVHGTHVVVEMRGTADEINQAMDVMRAIAKE